MDRRYFHATSSGFCQWPLLGAHLHWQPFKRTSRCKEAHATMWELKRRWYDGCQSEELVNWYSMDSQVCD